MTRSREDQFCVYLYDRLVGRLHRYDDVTRFVFEEDYLETPNRPVLGLRFEENPRARHQSHMRLPPWFSNLLPEGRLREWIAKARRTSIQREMELLAQVGHDLPGAVRVFPAETEIPIDTSVFDEIDRSIDERFDSLWSFSLAGVGLKFSMLSNGDKLTIPTHGEEGDWILKMPEPALANVPKNEFAMMTLARTVGISVPDIRLIHRDQLEALPDRFWPTGENWAYAIRRFDRGSNGIRFHIEDMAQVRGFYPDMKYSGSIETVAALVYRRHDIESLREFVRRLVFNIIIGNGDAHLKNWSLIYLDRKIPTLAPAYDIVSTFVYRPPFQGAEEMALRFSRSRRFERIRLQSFSELENRLGVKADLADIARDTVELILKEWHTAIYYLADTPELGKTIENFVKERYREITR